MPIFGLDISHHQGDRPQSWFNAAKAEGIEYIILKATEGTGFTDSRFQANLTKARNAGMLVAAYHYQRSAFSAVAQVEHIKRNIPRDVPVIPDVEHGSGSASLTRQIVDELLRAGYKVPVTYFPRWYWQQIGSPSLVGLPPLWSSRYPDNTQGGLWDEYNDAPSSYWNGFGGLPVAILQFSSSGRVAGYAPLDLNAFNGSRNELNRLFGGVSIPETPEVSHEEDDTMHLSLKDASDRPKVDGLTFEVTPNSAQWKRAWLSVVSLSGDHHVKIEFLNDSGVIPDSVWVPGDAEGLLEGDHYPLINVPSYARGVRVTYTLKRPSAVNMNNALAVTVFGRND